jgi:hypothetical protein
VSRDSWREERREANRAGRFVLVWVLVVIAIALLIGAVVWGIRVITSPVTGAGDAYATKNSAANWTAAQARFEDEYADIVATDRKITATAGDADDKSTRGDTYRGLRSYCLSAVGEYNADARKYLARDFRAADLPPQIDNTDPTTDCEPTR